MITVLTGKNEVAIHAALTDMVSAARSERGEFGVELIDASEKDADAVIQAVQSVPFLVERKLVVVHEPHENKQLLERIDQLIDRTADQVDVVIRGSKLDKRSVAWKTLKKHADIRDYPEMKQNELPKWVVAQAQERGMTLQYRDAVYLVERAGVNTFMLQNELAKLSIVTSEITKSDIDRHVEQSPQSSIFDMLDAVFAGDAQAAVAQYRDQRKQRIDPHYIVSMLTWQLHSLTQAVFAQPQSESALIAAGQSPYSARKTLKIARDVSKDDAKRHVRDLLNLDRDIKSVADPDAALELYLLTV